VHKGGGGIVDLLVEGLEEGPVDQIELPVDLVGQGGLGGDLAAAVRDPGGLGGEGLVATPWRTTGAADQQFGHRAAVAGIVLQSSQ
jgi:hypothetical protein